MLSCPICKLGGPRIKVLVTRGKYRQRRCTNCRHKFFTFEEEVCTKAEFYLAEMTARARRKELEAAGQAPERRKGPAPKPQAVAPPPPMPDVAPAAKLLPTGHYVQELAPGVRQYRMKL
jgi:hypothetical protein